MTYYPINEDAARRAKNMNSFSDYKEGSATASYRSMVDEAAALALSRVEGAGNNNIKIELDWDDGRPIYEGEIRYGALEYEFEMDAYTGDFIEWSMD